MTTSLLYLLVGFKTTSVMATTVPHKINSIFSLALKRGKPVYEFSLVQKLTLFQVSRVKVNSHKKKFNDFWLACSLELRIDLGLLEIKQLCSQDSNT